MSDLIKFSGKTVNECLEKASADLNVEIEKIDYEVVQEAKPGVFGIGKKDAVIQIVNVNEKDTNIETASDATENVSVEKENNADDATTNVSENEVDSSSTATALSEEEISEKIECVKSYLTNVIKKMGIEEIEVTYTATADGADFVLSCSSENKGNLIGKRGETLDALQYLSSVIVNRDSDDYFRVTLDSNGYRDKRRETLQQLALKIAKGVYKTGRNKTLEPMNPYERRIIHSVIADFKGVSSHSVGEEPYRKVVITCDNPKKNNYRKGGYKGSNRGKRNNSKYRSDKDYVPKPKSMDSMKTSFEKEYNKPKPEDSISGNLYGKIEL